MRGYLIFLLFFFTGVLFGQTVTAPTQPAVGFGSSDYKYSSVKVINEGAVETGYYIFYPDSSAQIEKHVVLFLHGYGAYNPMIFEGWIKHIVKKGGVVIYPRYQENLFAPPTEEFADNVAIATEKAFERIKEEKILIDKEKLFIMGHSYGGALSAFLCLDPSKYKLPQPLGIFCAEPGTSIFKGGKVDSYDSLSSSIKLVIVVGDRDLTVGEKLGRLIYNTSDSVSNKLLLRQHTVKYASAKIKSSHYEPYSITSDPEYNFIKENYTSKRALNESEVNVVDFFGYWYLTDALIEECLSHQTKKSIFELTEFQDDLQWSDGTPLDLFEVIGSRNENEDLVPYH